MFLSFLEGRNNLVSCRFLYIFLFDFCLFCLFVVVLVGVFGWFVGFFTWGCLFLCGLGLCSPCMCVCMYVSLSV